MKKCIFNISPQFNLGLVCQYTVYSPLASVTSNVSISVFHTFRGAAYKIAEFLPAQFVTCQPRLPSLFEPMQVSQEDRLPPQHLGQIWRKRCAKGLRIMPSEKEQIN